MGEDLEVVADLLGVDRDHQRLRAVRVAHARDELRLRHGRAVDRDLVGPCVQEVAHVLARAHATADRERHRDRARAPLDHREERAPRLVARGDVEEGDLVRALLAVARGELHRIAGVAQPDEVHAFDDAPFLDVEARDDALDAAHDAPSEDVDEGEVAASAENASSSVKAPP